jgi:hypothetical protein
MLAAATLLALAALVPADSARLTGVVTSTYNGRPLAGVTIALPSARRVTISDSLGRFELTELPDGPFHLRLQYRGRVNAEHLVELRGGETTPIVVLLDTSAADLAPVVVRAERMADLWGLAGFYHRRKLGYGRFFTPEDIAQRQPSRLSELLRDAGAAWGCVANGCGPVTMVRGRRCAMNVRIDGVSAWGERLDDLPPEHVGGVEVYRQRWGVPAEFGGLGLTESEWLAARLTGLGFLSLPRQIGLGSCGTVLIWTRDFRSRWES